MFRLRAPGARRAPAGRRDGTRRGSSPDGDVAPGSGIPADPTPADDPATGPDDGQRASADTPVTPDSSTPTHPTSPADNPTTRPDDGQRAIADTPVTPALRTSSTAVAGPAQPTDAAGTGAAGARRLDDRVLLVVSIVLALPFVFLGYGTDIDVSAVRATGELIRAGDYLPSRNPGVPVFEAIVAALDPLGGYVAINLATAVALAATVVGIARLVRLSGHRNGDLVALAFLVSPVALIAGTSTGDFIWALVFAVWGTVALWRDRSVAAAVLFALAVGSRSTTVLLVGAVLVADAWVPAHRRRAVTVGALLVPLGAALYVPAWLSHDRSFGFLSHTEGYRSLVNNLGRFAYKNYAFLGLTAAVVLAVLAPHLVRALRRWRTDGLVRLGVIGLLVTEALFFLVPWKAAHLLPSLLALLLWVAASDVRRRVLWVLVGALALNGLVAFRPLRPDRPDDSRGARVDPAVTAGLLVNDVECRIRYRDDDPRPDDEIWACSLEPMRGAPGDEATG